MTVHDLNIQGIKKRVILATLWIFVTLNYLYCDVLTLMDYTQLEQILTGVVGEIHMTEDFLLAAAVLMEIPIAMVLLSMVLKRKNNRLANIIAGSIKTIVMILTMFVGTEPTNYYLFFGTIEILSTSYIVWYAIKWSKAENEFVPSII